MYIFKLLDLKKIHISFMYKLIIDCALYFHFILKIYYKSMLYDKYYTYYSCYIYIIVSIHNNKEKFIICITAIYTL